MEFRFKPIDEMFEWVREYEDGSKVLVGQYWPGMSYNCTKRPVHDALRAQCKIWEEEGKIEIIPLAKGQKFVRKQVTLEGK